MVELRWTPQAADDLEAITNFIAADSPHYASLFAIESSPRSNGSKSSHVLDESFRNCMRPTFERSYSATTESFTGSGATLLKF